MVPGIWLLWTRSIPASEHGSYPEKAEKFPDLHIDETADPFNSVKEKGGMKPTCRNEDQEAQTAKRSSFFILYS